MIKFGVSGDVGSFSEEAGLIYAEKNQIEVKFNYLIDMEGVLSAIANGTADLGIFPVVNLRGGLVRMAFDAMGRYLFHVVDELWLEVEQCLLVKPDVTIDQIKNIVSHPQGIKQCKKYLDQYFSKVNLIEAEDTAKAARDLSENQLPVESAVIASKRAAEVYNLKILAENVQDDHPNLTAFIIVRQS